MPPRAGRARPGGPRIGTPLAGQRDVRPYPGVRRPPILTLREQTVWLLAADAGPRPDAGRLRRRRLDRAIDIADRRTHACADDRSDPGLHPDSRPDPRRAGDPRRCPRKLRRARRPGSAPASATSAGRRRPARLTRPARRSPTPPASGSPASRSRSWRPSCSTRWTAARSPWTTSSATCSRASFAPSRRSRCASSWTTRAASSTRPTASRAWTSSRPTSRRWPIRPFASRRGPSCSGLSPASGSSRRTPSSSPSPRPTIATSHRALAITTATRTTRSRR